MRSVGQGFPRTGLRGAWGPQGHTAHCGAPGPALCRQGGRDGTCRDGARLWLPALSAHHRAEGAWRAGPRPSVVAPGSGGLPCAACWSGAAVGLRPGSWGDRKPRADCHSAGQALRTRALRRSDSPGVELASAHCLAPRAEWGWLGSQAPSSWKPLEAQHSSAPCYCTALSPSATQNPWPLSCRGHSRGRVLKRGVQHPCCSPHPPARPCVRLELLTAGQKQRSLTLGPWARAVWWLQEINGALDGQAGGGRGATCHPSWAPRMHFLPLPWPLQT